jgi:hypothetical protein
VYILRSIHRYKIQLNYPSSLGLAAYLKSLLRLMIQPVITFLTYPIPHAHTHASHKGAPETVQRAGPFCTHGPAGAELNVRGKDTGLKTTFEEGISVSAHFPLLLFGK